MKLKTIASHIVSIFMNHWIILYRTREFGLIDNRTKFICKFFESLCAFLGIKRLMTSAYHPQVNVNLKNPTRRLLHD